MRLVALGILVLALPACSSGTDPADDAGCSDSTLCASGQTCEAGMCVDESGASDSNADGEGEGSGDTTDTPGNEVDSEDEETRLTTDATWPATVDDYQSSHVSLITSLELSEESSGNQFGTLLRLIASQAGVEVTGYFDEALAAGDVVSLVDHWGIEASTAPQAFLMGHLNGTWADGSTWEDMLSGAGSVTINPDNFDDGSGSPKGAYDYAELVDGNLAGENGYMILDMPPGDLLSGIKVHESQLSATDVDASGDTLSYAGVVSGWVAISEWYEGLNRAFEHMCGCAGFEEGQNLWSETGPGVYSCDSSLFDTAPCVGTENEAICTGGIPLCATLTFMISGDLDKYPDIPGDDAMSVILEIETTPVTCNGLTSVEGTD